MKKYENLSDIWKLKGRGKRDSQRHKELIRKAIKSGGKNIITEYDIIKSDGTKKVKIPIKFLDKYKFKYGKLNDGNGGVGQGVGGKPGDKYKIKNAPSDGDGKAGNQDGDRYYDAEVSIDEIVDIMLEELNLPWMEPKKSQEMKTETEIFSSVEKQGIMPNLDLRRTVMQNMKRHAAKGDPKIGAFHRDDFRFKTWDVEREYHSNAAVYMMLDRSGSMDKEKTDIAKTFFFWMVQFLRRRYDKIDIIFIAHDTKAWVEDEERFFKINSSGGTKCSSAFKLAYEHMKNHHPEDRWNNYVLEFSDGDNWGEDNGDCVNYVEKLLPMCRAIGYGEIIPSGQHSWLKESERLSAMLNEKINRTRFVILNVNKKEKIFDSIKEFFNVDGISKKPKEE